jgi:hypothetical protein
MSSAIFTNAATKAIANPASAEIEQNSLSNSNFMSSEPLNLVPKFYSYSVRALLLPIRKVQHDLVMLYFRHIHPMFPVVDEFHITQLHQKYRGQEEFMDPGSFAIYHALMAAAFAVRIESYVHNDMLMSKSSTSTRLSYFVHHTDRCTKVRSLNLIKLRYSFNCSCKMARTNF